MLGGVGIGYRVGMVLIGNSHPLAVCVALNRVVPVIRCSRSIHSGPIVHLLPLALAALLMVISPCAAQISAEQNLRTCLAGQYPALCDHGRLTPERRKQAEAAERDANLRTCLTGQYPTLCTHSMLTPAQRGQVDVAERRANFETCRTGQYAVLCRKDLLTNEQRRNVESAERQYNVSVCLDGRYAPLCKLDLLTPAERAQAVNAEKRTTASKGAVAIPKAGSTSARACYESTIQTPQPFMGNNDEIFKLSDGTLWQVQNEYSYLYAYYAAVVICPNSGRLHVAGKSLSVMSMSHGASNELSPVSAASNLSPDAIESQISGAFEGWSGETIFKLMNGQIWQQSQYAYTYQYIYSPHVLIFRIGGGYKMQVDGLAEMIGVTKLR